MRKIYILLTIFVFGLSHVLAQDLKRADTYFKRTFYSDAIPLYEELAKTNRSRSVVQNLADSYYNTNQLPQAAKWYSYLTSVYGEHLDESYFFKYSQTLKSVGEYAEATEVLMEYYNSKGEKEKVEKLQADLNYLENVAAMGDRFEMNALALNTPFSEFGAAEIDSTLVYAASEKKGLPIISKTYRWNNEGYLDLYAHPVNMLDLADSVSVNYSKTINTKMHEGTFAVTKDGKTFYFTRNNYSKGKKRTDAKKVSYLKIYKANWKDEKWEHIEELPFNAEDFSNEHPTLSADGKTMYFASDRPGGFGSFDLYSVAIYENGSYGEPKNLGAEINTERKEQFPFVNGDDNLYFSSNGHPGFGLLDIFVSRKQDGKYQKPDNVGKPLNGGFDDFAYTMNKDGRTGYFSSNRPSGKGSDDIYSFTETKPLLIENCQQLIVGTLTDKTTGQPLANAEITFLNADGTVVSSHTTAADASFKFLAECASEYRIEAEKEGYENNFKTIQTSTERNATKDGSLSLLSEQEKEKQLALALQKREEEKAKLALAEAERMREADKAAELARIQADKENEKIQVATLKKEEKERLKRIEKTIQQEEAIVKKGDKTIIETEEIHFDYSLWYLRRESRERLGKVIEIMKANPGMVLEIGTHTDIRGNDDYNKKLSQKRADSAKNFLVENGIAAKRVIAKGYGESQPIVKCETENSCSEEDHEWNRRCEFVIVQWD